MNYGEIAHSVIILPPSYSILQYFDTPVDGPFSFHIFKYMNERFIEGFHVHINKAICYVCLEGVYLYT